MRWQCAGVCGNVAASVHPARAGCPHLFIIAPPSPHCAVLLGSPAGLLPLEGCRRQQHHAPCHPPTGHDAGVGCSPARTTAAACLPLAWLQGRAARRCCAEAPWLSEQRCPRFFLRLTPSLLSLQNPVAAVEALDPVVTGVLANPGPWYMLPSLLAALCLGSIFPCPS